MPYIVIENFNGGMDTRRMAAAGTPGTLLELTNAHITRGGEIEKRKAYSAFASLPSGTLGLARDADGLIVFGSGADPGVPAGITYQRLQHPDGHNMTRLRSWDLYAGKVYAAAEFSNGDILHFYDGTRLETWFDGKARGTFVVRKTGTNGGSKSEQFFVVDKDSEELEVEVFMTNPDDIESPISLTNGVVNIAAGDSGFDFSNDVQDAINANTGTTGVSASTAVVGDVQLRLTTDSEYDNFDGRDIWFTVSELNIFKVAPDSTPRSARCVSEGSCTNIFRLDANAEGGVEPYTYSWAIVDDGGGASVSLSDPDIADPVLTVSNPTQASGSVCATVSVTLKVEVTDSASGGPQTAEKVFSVTSTHCPPGAYEPILPGDGGTIYNQVN